MTGHRVDPYDALGARLMEYLAGDDRLVQVMDGAFADARVTDGGDGRGHRRSMELVARCDELIETTCRRLTFVPSLVALRSLPKDLVTGWRSYSSGADRRGGVLMYSEGILHATNALVRWAGDGIQLTSEQERHGLVLEPEVIDDAVRLAVWAALSRWERMHARTLAYSEAIEDEDAWPLIDRYNGRQGALADPDGDGPPVVTLANQPDNAFRLKATLVGANRSLSLAAANFLALPVPVGTLLGHLAFLWDHELPGLPAGRAFWRGWIGLNNLLLGSLPRESWTEPIPARSAALGRFDRLHDLLQQGYVGTSRAALQAGGLDLGAILGADAPTTEELSATIEGLVVRPPFDDREDVAFIERPYLFYEVGPDVLIWDVLRHAGLLRALTRRVIAGGGKVANLSGEAFERWLLERLRRVPGAEVHANVRLGTGAGAMQIDVVCVVGELIVCVEAKAYMRQSAGFAPDVQRLGSRIDGFRSVLVDRDRRLAEHRSALATRFALGPGAVAVNVVCTMEVELTPSFEPWWWLDVGCPRVCTVTELEAWLSGARQVPSIAVDLAGAN